MVRWTAILAAAALVLSLAPPADAQNQNGRGGAGAQNENDGPAKIRAPSIGPRDTARTRGRAEFVATVPPRQAAAATQALAGAGAQILRVRTLAALGRRLLVVDPGPALSLDRARAVLAAAAPQAVLDAHHFYRYAQGQPRLYAARLLGTPPLCRAAAGLRIGLIDGPVDRRHPALTGARITATSVLVRGERPADATHGTAVAGLMVGEDASGALAGYAPGARLYAAAAFARERRGPAADVERIAVALDWLIASRVRLINMSFAGPANAALDDLLRQAAGRGAIMVAAAGNDGKALAAYPAAAGPVIAVTAVDAASRRYRSANTGGHIEFAAPGVDLYVAGRRGGTYASGTSYAAPIVTALAARLMARGARSAGALRAGLRRQTVDLGQPGRDTRFGWGLVRAPGC